MKNYLLRTLLLICLCLGFVPNAHATAPANPESYTLPFTYNSITYTKAFQMISLSNDTYANKAVIYFHNGDATFHGGYSVFKVYGSSDVLKVNSADDIFGNGNDEFTEIPQDPDDPNWFGLANGVCFDSDYLKSSTEITQETNFSYQNSGYHCNFQFVDTDTVIIDDSNYFNIFNTKLPLTGGKDWLQTVEIGGEVYCGGGTDSYHTGSGYYSIDFDDLSDSGSEVDTPALAIASGVVDSYGNDGATTGFGHWIIIDHRNGFKTRYAHLKNTPSFTSGSVPQGKVLGIVGNTGYSFGTHIHLQLYYGGSSASTVTELGTLLMEGNTLSSYVVSSSTSQPSCYTMYPSTNTAIP